jgi:hypothetical protein
MENAKVFRLTTCATLLCCVLLGGLAAQEPPVWAPVSGPVVGHVFESPSGIRPILGIPGAATLGRPVAPGPSFESVVFSPARDYALGLLSRGRLVVLLADLSSSSRFVELPVRGGAGRIAISPSGDAAALYYPETRTVVVLTGLPDSPTVSWSLEIPYIDGRLAALAASDGGGAVLIAGTGEQTPVWVLAPGSGAQILSYVSTLPSLTFLAGSDDALIADGGAGSIMLVRDTKGQPVLTQIGGAAEGISRPLAVAVTPDNRRVLVANAEPAGVVSLSLVGEDPVALPCDCRVTGLERLAGGAAFRISDPGDGPLWLLDAAGSPPRVVFVPNPPASSRRVVRPAVPIRRGGVR